MSAMLTLFRKNSGHYRPTHGKQRFTDIDFKALHAQGISYLILDVDNTLALHKGPEVHPDVRAHLHRAMSNGYIRGICLLSNAVIPKKRRRERLTSIAEQIGAEHLLLATVFTGLKPSPQPYKKALQLLGNPNLTQVVMIGDQLFTDILGANRLGIPTLMVEPLGPDPWYIQLKRQLEKRHRL